VTLGVAGSSPAPHRFVSGCSEAVGGRLSHLPAGCGGSHSSVPGSTRRRPAVRGYSFDRTRRTVPGGERLAVEVAVAGDPRAEVGRCSSDTPRPRCGGPAVRPLRATHDRRNEDMRTVKTATDERRR